MVVVTSVVMDDGGVAGSRSAVMGVVMSVVMGVVHGGRDECRDGRRQRS